MAELKFSIDVTSEYADEFSISECDLSVGPCLLGGRRSHQVLVSINKGEKSVAGFCLNKNQALYLYKLLEAFCNEQDIDITDED